MEVGTTSSICLYLVYNISVLAVTVDRYFVVTCMARNVQMIIKPAILYGNNCSFMKHLGLVIVGTTYRAYIFSFIKVLCFDQFFFCFIYRFFSIPTDLDRLEPIPNFSIFVTKNSFQVDTYTLHQSR